MSDTELNRILLKGLRDYSSLDKMEKAQFIHTFMAFISFSQNAFNQWHNKICLVGVGTTEDCLS